MRNVGFNIGQLIYRGEVCIRSRHSGNNFSSDLSNFKIVFDLISV